MKATTLVQHQHRLLVQVACALEYERHHVGALRLELLDDFDRHVAAVTHLLVRVAERGLPPEPEVGASLGALRGAVDRIRSAASTREGVVDPVRNLRWLLVHHGDVIEEHLVAPMAAYLDPDDLEGLGVSAECVLRPSSPSSSADTSRVA